MQNSYISNGDANLHWLLLQIENSSCTFPKNRWICQIRPQAIIADSRHQMSNWITTRVSFSPKYAISISFQYSRKTLKHVKSNIQWHIFTKNIFIYSWQHDFIDIFSIIFQRIPFLEDCKELYQFTLYCGRLWDLEEERCLSVRTSYLCVTPAMTLEIILTI